MSIEQFHPLVARWFAEKFEQPSEPQRLGWPAIAAGKHALIAAPTGSGKTLTAFLAIIDRLFRQALAGQLKDEINCIYVSPLRALSNDMQKNLAEPLREIRELALQDGYNVPEIRIGLRTGDTPAKDRTAMIKKPPQIVVTTPESLYLLLTAGKSRERLGTTQTLIIDEIHAMLPDKRGAHLALSLERLESICERPLQRIGLSATQKPIELVADFLLGTRDRSTPLRSVDWVADADKVSDEKQKRLFKNDFDDAEQIPASAQARTLEIINIGHARDLDLGIEIPPSPLSAICSHEQWAEVNARVIELVNSHRSTLIFVNTRRMAERVSHQLTELLGEDQVSSHHGSLSADIRLGTEQRLKTGQLKAVVATASLELGIDVGYIDLVIQLGSPDGISKFLQRIGRSGHALGLTPKGRLFALTRDELVECMGLIRAVRSGRLDAICCRNAPLDVLAQQLVAEVAATEWETDKLFELVRRAWPFRELERKDFDDVVEYLSEGITHQAGRSRTYLHHDQIQKRVRPRRSARLVAVNNAGSIPDIGSYRVVAEPENVVVGSLDEDFAVESQAGDVFLLGNTSWRLKGIRGNDAIVIDAQGAPPSVPFWRGESPGRTLELSEEVSRLREEMEAKLIAGESKADISKWLKQETHCCDSGAEQITEYVAAQRAALGLVPTHNRIVFERFFDETGGMQLVVHAPFGSRITRAWGFAMRKRFCRSFDFELQATADDDGFILTLGPQHSFPIESLFPMLTPANAYKLLEQALIYVPTFQLRWRWNLNTALIVERRKAGKRVPPALQRFRSDDLLTAVFPKLTGCQEEHVGDHEIPEHPLVKQTMEDCFNEALNFNELVKILERVEKGEITFVAKETREPSPFCYELLNANPYAFLDGGEAIDRRARAVGTRRSVTVESVSDLSRLDPLAIERVLEEASPVVRDADELHDYLLTRILLPKSEGQAWPDMLQQLQEQHRVTLITVENRPFYIPAEKLLIAQVLWPELEMEPEVSAPERAKPPAATTDARVEILRGWMEYLGPVTTKEIAAQLGWTESQTDATFEALEGEGLVLRGKFRESSQSFSEENTLNPPPASLNHPEWCHRRLLARIHRLTLEGLRKQIEPVDVATYMRFLFRHHGFHPSTRREGAEGLYETITQLQGFDLPAGYWERDLLKYRVRDYSSAWLDELCMTGEISWGRLYPNPKPIEGKGRPLKTLSRNSLIALFRRDDAHWLLPERSSLPTDNLSGVAQDLLMVLQRQGAMFAGDIEYAAQLLPTQLTDALGELISRGWITSDGFAGLRGLIGQSRNTGNVSYPRRMTGGRRPKTLAGRAGRWSLWRRDNELDDPEKMRGRVEAWAWQLLHRWGVVFRDLLEREQGAPRWYELVQCYRRLEARGEIRGGRFIRGVAGEQYASADTVGQLRKLRDENLDGEELVMLNAVDPLNLAGVLTTQSRVPALANNRIVYWKGEAVVGIQKKQFRLLKALTTENALILAKLLDFSPGEIAAARREYVKQNPAPTEAVAVTEEEPALF
ncbi:DEAD/DEAH box helicase [Rubinisphaera sp.]|uniref:DEAD/DEAH box helicase n=1 Tax=Rubinisphaera sp. TaxID=2024857 RepID=UPI000C105014|nr:DEAD/DEAH box helicase [Rubinisphaera sp.]MBV12240.1 DEAD/DEAH box helicase [Rubinisphaera sp.]